MLIFYVWDEFIFRSRRVLGVFDAGVQEILLVHDSHASHKISALPPKR